MSEIIQNPSSKQQEVMKKSATKRSSTGKPKPTTTNATNAAARATKQQPLKVVYISNPMKVEASAAEFRALVQELTGRDAVEWPDPFPPKRAPHHQHQVLDDDHQAVVPGLEAQWRSGLGQPVGCVGSSSDLVNFGPFDGDYCDHDDEDQMVVIEQEFSTYYGSLQHQ